MVTRTARHQIIGSVLDMVDCKESDELRPHRIKKDTADLRSIVTSIGECMNPFEHNSWDNLICLSSGRACTDDAKSDLPNCKEIGRVV